MAVITKDMEMSAPNLISDNVISQAISSSAIGNNMYTKKIYKSTIKNFYLKTIMDKLKKLETDNTTSQMFNKDRNNSIVIFIRNILPNKKLGNKLILEYLNNKELEVKALIYLSGSVSLNSVEKIKVVLSVIKINNNEVVVKVRKAAS